MSAEAKCDFLALKKNEVLIHAAIGMNLENNKSDAKGHILYESIYMRCPE